jgi:trk system potassium uptake protein
VSVLRDGSGFVPKSDTIIQAGDEVLAVLSPGDEAEVCQVFAPPPSDNGGPAIRRPG